MHCDTLAMHAFFMRRFSFNKKAIYSVPAVQPPGMKRSGLTTGTFSYFSYLKNLLSG